ncbi:MAG: DUF349 domain-containing protein [Balneolaceae bacterium]|nr:DUF349 domain-containing protein [Balneolaceae bacterium]
MTKKTENNNIGSTHLFENNFAYITEKGEVNLKATEFFDERTLTTIDPESIEDQVMAFEKAFSNLSSKFERFLEEAESLSDADTEELKKRFDALVTEAKEFDAIGDFETLLGEAKEKFEAMVEKEDESEPVEDLNGEQKPADKKETEKQSDDSKEEPKREEPAEKSLDISSEEKSLPEIHKPGEGLKTEDSVESTESELINKSSDEAEETSDAGEEESPLNYYKNLADKSETLLELSDWAHATMEFDNINNLWEQGPDPGDADIKPYRKKIDELREQLEEKKRAHYEEQKRIRQENLEKKKELLKQLKTIIDEKKWTHTRDVSKIKGRWENIKPIPASEQEKLESSFNSLLSTFDDHKVDRLVKKKQQEEDNLTGKLVILEKMEKFLEGVDESSDWKELDKKLSDYSRQFRKIGRIPAEKNQEVWDRFHSVNDDFHAMRFKYDKKYRQNIEKFLSKKKKLIDEAEALIDSDDLAKAARQVNKLHRRWKKTGNLPQKDENELWDRFKAATDAFNQRKSENIDTLREQEDINYDEKLELIEKADELKESEEWEKTHHEFQKLMDQWKKIGPVPRRKSGKIWKKFKGAMDYFYDRRRDYFKEVKEERKDNLKEKEDILDQLKELKSHENPIEAVELAKPLQEEFKKAGYVPIKHKNRMWKEYRETCDVIYDRFRAAKSAAQIVGKENVEHYSTDDIAEIKKKQEQAEKLRKQIDRLSSELLQMKESLSYFKPSSSSSPLLDDVKKRIDNAENDINKKEEKLQQLELDIDRIKRES